MPKVCLVMIVKNEAHIITDTLRHLLKYVPIDTWSICDTGSTDSTKEDITRFFTEQGIPGQLHETEWRDFGHNRTVAFEKAAASADYSFVWDADDSIEGDFVFPTELAADWYKFMFGNKSGFRYSRCQLFSNRKRWKYVGVLHEYPACVESCDSAVDVKGDYYFVSGRSGARNKNPLKYHDDARILELAYKRAVDEKDPIHCRYAFYCAQSYASANMVEKAAEFYKIVLTLDNWYQEKYMSCLSIYNHLKTLAREQEGLAYLVESFKYDRTRVECIYRLVKYYCIGGLPEVALAYYGLVQNYFENEYLGETGRERLFASMDEYDFYLPYYMIIVADRTKRHDIAAKMYDIIFTKRFTFTTKWWIDNLFTNAQFCYHAFPKTVEFLGKMFDYVNDLRAHKIYLDEKHNMILTKIVESYTPVLCAAASVPPAPPPLERLVTPRVMLTMTTCKRLELFRRTVNSILNTWTDVNHIDAFFCVDDNSSEEDRAVMLNEFPFFEYYMKGSTERGHRESMNIIWEKLAEVKPTYWIHLEDDWMYFHRGSYVERGIQALEKYRGQNINQVVFNRNYGVVYNDLERTGGFEQGDRIILHELNPNLPGRHSGYWPHYSLQPSICRTATILELGDYTTNHRFFERGYAEKYNAAGHKTAFFDSVYSTHIGKQHWETDGQNAYALNEVSQFQLAAPPNEPLVGSMAEHLDQIIRKIRSKRPFGLIRPSDGEYSILKDRTLTNCDAWTWKAGGVLSSQLAESIRTVDPNLYIGIPCNTCNKPWNCTDEIYTDFTEKFGVPAAQITYANIFMNSNWAKWTEFIRNYPGGGFYLVGSGGSAEQTSLAIKGRHEISPTLVNSWDTDGEAETARLLEFIADLRGELICFAAGPLSKVWIPLCMQRNPANMYVDVGASLDVFTKGVTNRMYVNPSHPFAKEACVFRRERKPNILYFCVFYNRDYCRLARLLLTSMRLYSSTSTFDILIMTTEEFRKDLELVARELRIQILIYTLPLKTVFEAACARLRVFDWEEIGAYKTALYLDTDILVKGDLEPLFDLVTEDKLYAIESGTIASKSFGVQFFEDTVDYSTTGFNSGTLLFRTSDKVRTLFANTWAQAMEHTAAPPYCMDQPFLNYQAIKEGLHDNQTLNPFVSLYEDNEVVTNEATSVLCHFSYPIGNFAHKYQRMTAYFRKCLAARKEEATMTATAIAGKSYSWESGYIMFTGSDLETTWEKGAYKVLGDWRVMASWRGFDHFLTFLNDGAEYISVRTKPEDFGVVFGTLQTIAGETPEYPLILHTCDKYERFWNHWYFFFRKYVSGVSKVYFVTEEKEPVFSDEVTVVKTGAGPWGKRLLAAFEQITEPYVYYMQEDFWPTQAFNPSTYVPTFFHYHMDALRITIKSPLYSLDQVKGPLYRFKQNSDYLMTHQFSLWKRDYFMRWIPSEDEPWQNEMQQSVEIAKTKHAIYLIDAPWYEATVRRGTLQPNGKQLLDLHSEQIAQSFVKNDWYAKFLLKIREHLATDSIESFPTWPILHFTMFTPANAAERSAIGYEGEPPKDVLERNREHHEFLWDKFSEFVDEENINGIFEFGGGYGQLRKVVHEMHAEIPYAIYDFPELHAIQRHFLDPIPTEFYTSTDVLPTGKHNVFISFWAYTECPKEVRDGLIPFFKDAAFDVLFLGLAQRFQLDNIAYLKGLADTLGYSVEFVPINEMKSHDGTQFFGILRKL
jgi:glycosyltransferase involved in cell wall biosynthesis